VVANQGRTTKYHPNQKIPQSFLAKCYLLQDNWFEDPTCMVNISDKLILDSWDTDSYYFNEISNPRVLEARPKTSKYNKDNPLFNTATSGLFQAQFWQAMRTKFSTLTKEFDCWNYMSPATLANASSLALGHSKSNATQMDASKSSKLDFVRGAISNRKESTILRPGLQLFNG
jgi:hypothetical protein